MTYIERNYEKEIMKERRREKERKNFYLFKFIVSNYSNILVYEVLL